MRVRNPKLVLLSLFEFYQCDMKFPVPVRLTELAVAFAVIVAVVVVTERSAWKQISRLRSDLQPEVVERSRSADRLRADMLEAHLFSFTNGKATNAPAFGELRQKLEESLRREAEESTSAQEQRILQELASEFRAYSIAAQSGALAGAAASSAEHVFKLETHFRRMLLLVEQLRAENDRAAQTLLDSAAARLTKLQRFLFLALLGLLLSGGIILAIAYRRTITPLRSSLAESRILMERQEKLASLGVFATGIAHEIRNPITAIKVRLFTLKASHRPSTSEHEDLEVIESEINRLERIVQEFLRFARPAEPELMVLPVDGFLREVYELMMPELKKRGVRFELATEASETVRIDPEKMKQVLLNFIHNAADAIEEEGTVTLSSKSGRRVVGGRSLPAVIIEIKDTGKGMPPEVQKRLFDPFFTTKEKGTGLGLPIAARIVEKHGGLIQYQTAPGEGTTFSILLPRANS